MAIANAKAIVDKSGWAVDGWVLTGLLAGSVIMAALAAVARILDARWRMCMALRLLELTGSTDASTVNADQARMLALQAVQTRNGRTLTLEAVARRAAQLVKGQNGRGES